MSERQPEQISLDEELKKYALANPLVPFDIITASGDRYEITENLQVAVNATTVVVLLPKTGTQIIRKNQIVAIHVHEPAA